MTGIVVLAARCAALLLLAFSALGCSASPAGRQAGTSVSMPTVENPASAAPGADRAFTSPVPSDLETIAFAKSIGADCSDDSGKFECVSGHVMVGDYFDVTLHPECSLADFALHTTSRTELDDRLVPLPTRLVAVIRPDDALCAQAVGSIEGEPEYYYVVAQAPGASCETTGQLQGHRKGCRAGWLVGSSLAAASLEKIRPPQIPKGR